MSVDENVIEPGPWARRSVPKPAFRHLLDLADARCLRAGLRVRSGKLAVGTTHARRALIGVVVRREDGSHVLTVDIPHDEDIEFAAERAADRIRGI